MALRSLGNRLASFKDYNSRSETGGSRPAVYEYVFFGGTTGTITVPNIVTTLKVAGCGGGANGVAAGPAGLGGEAGGGGAASNIVGNTYSLAGITSIYYSVGNAGQDTFVKQNDSSGADIIRLSAGSGTSGGPAAGGGPNAVAGGAGGAQVARFGSGSPGSSSPSPGGCGGGGGGGGASDNGQPGRSGGAGGPFSANPNAIQTFASGPAPSFWSFRTTPVPTSSTDLSAETQGQNFAYAHGGVSYVNAPGSGGGRGGGAGVGIQYNDPSSPENGNYFGGGGGSDGCPAGAGAYPSVNARHGGKGILVLQFY